MLLYLTYFVLVFNEKLNAFGKISKIVTLLFLIIVSYNTSVNSIALYIIVKCYESREAGHFIVVN